MNHTKTSVPACFAKAEESIGRVARKVGAPNESRDDVILMRLITMLSRRYDELVSEAIDPEQLNSVMFKTLLMAFGSANNEVNPSELSSATGESRANMTRICDQLCDRGLIDRHAAESDRRRIVVSITPAGERLVRKLLPGMRESLRQAHAVFGATDKKQVERLLKTQLSGLEAVLERGDRR